MLKRNLKVLDIFLGKYFTIEKFKQSEVFKSDFEFKITEKWGKF